MKLWAITICAIRSKLEKHIAILDDKIEKIALNPNGECIKKCQMITALMNEKSMLINLAVLYDAIKDRIGEQKCQAMERYGLKKTERDSERAISYATEATKVLKNLGYSDKKFTTDYALVKPVTILYATIQGKVKHAKNHASEKQDLAIPLIPIFNTYHENYDNGQA